MGSFIGSVVLHTNDSERGAAFWRDALGYVAREENAEHYRRRVEISPEVAAEIAGVSPDDIARDKELRALIAAQSEDDE